MALNSLLSITLSVLFLSVFTYLQGQYFWDIQIHLESETCKTYRVSSVSSLFFFYQCSPTCTEAFCHIMGNFHTSVLRGKLTLCWKITLKANLQSYQQQNNNNKTHTHIHTPWSTAICVPPFSHHHDSFSSRNPGPYLFLVMEFRWMGCKGHGPYTVAIPAYFFPTWPSQTYVFNM